MVYLLNQNELCIIIYLQLMCKPRAEGTAGKKETRCQAVTREGINVRRNGEKKKKLKMNEKKYIMK